MSNDYIKLLCDNGGEVYIVGGAIRNYLYDYYHNTKTDIKDFDYLIRKIEMNKLINILNNVGSVKEVGLSFGIVLFTPDDDTKLNTKLNIEFAIPRYEESTGTNYRDFVIKSNCNISIEDDLLRRDATINAMCFRIFSLNDLELFNDKTTTKIIDNIIDPFNGTEDIKNKIWKCVDEPNKRFNEDPTRIMRAFRQCAELNLTIDNTTLNAIKSNYHILNNLIPKSYVRLFKEFFRMMNTNNYYKNLECMNEIGILTILNIHNPNIKILNKFTNIKFILKIALLLNIHTNNIDIKKWIKTTQITATNYFTSNDINFLIMIQDYCNEIISISSKYDMLKLINKTYKYFKLEYSNKMLEYKDVLTYFKLVELIDDTKYDELNNYLNILKGYPFSINDIKINGNDLMNKWNIKGKNINEIKYKILNMIYQDELINEFDSIEIWLNNFLKID